MLKVAAYVSALFGSLVLSLVLVGRPVEMMAEAPTYIFQDEFDDGTIGSQWAVANRTGDISNNEEQCYLPDNVIVGGGYLNIITRPDDSGCQPYVSYGNYSYSSGMVSWSTFNYRYGKLDVRAKVAGGVGPWPAIWLLGTNCQVAQSSQDWYSDSGCNWPQPGADEIDVAEFLQHNFVQVNQQIHTSSSNQGCRPSVSNASANWHVYSLDWQPTRLQYLVDGVVTCTITSSVSATPKFLIINTAMGGVGGGSIDSSTLPVTMSIDYVRVEAGAMATATPIRTSTASPSPTRTPQSTATPMATATPMTTVQATSTGTQVPTSTSTAVSSSTPTSASWQANATVQRGFLSRGSTQQVTVQVKASRTATALVDIEIYSPTGARVFQRSFDRQSFTADVSRNFVTSWRVPSNAQRGDYTVRIGVFAPGWGRNYLWDNNAASFTVR